MEIYLCKVNIFDFKLFVGYPLEDLGKGIYQGVFGIYIHRHHGNENAGCLPIPAECAVKWNLIPENKLPIYTSYPGNEGRLQLVEHNINEINHYLSYYKVALQEAQRYLLLM